jgi:tetratricopeptide (TPR) repeat protein
MLEDMAEVKRLIGLLNGLLAAVDDVSPAEFRRRMWFTGVQARALYIPGAHMARTIDERLGRAALVRTMGSGPRTFMQTYNTLANGDLKIHEYRLADTLSAYQRLRQAAVGGDYEMVARIVGLVAGDEVGGNPAVHVLNTTGWLLLYRGRTDLAGQVFKQYARLFPDSPNPYEGLGKVYLAEGHMDLAAQAFRELLRISPGSAVAEEVLEALGDIPASGG